MKATKEHKMQKYKSRTSSKVYVANDINKAKFKDEKYISYSEDGKYILVYTQADLLLLYDFYEWSDAEEYVINSSYEDLLYHNILEDAGSKKKFDQGKYQRLMIKIDSETEIVATFKVCKPFISSVEILFNINDSENNGANITFILGTVTNVKEKAYMTFKRQNEK
jgi:hypothetical protein